MIRTSLILLAAAGACPASLLVEEPFDYVDAAPLTGQSGGSGWAAAWTQDGETSTVHHRQMSYVDPTGNRLVTSGGDADTAASATSRNFRVVAGGPMSGVWVSFLFHLPASNLKFEGVNFYNGSSSIFAVSNTSNGTGPNITLNNHVVSSGSGVTTSLGAFGETFFIVLHLIDGGGAGGNDRIEMFVNPMLDGTPATPSASIEAPAYAFDRVRLAGQDGASLRIDEIRIGDLFEDVAPYIPGQGADADGDGLTDAQEIELGLNPSVSDEDLILAIQQNPEFFGLYDNNGILGLSQGGVVYEGSGGLAEVIFEIQQGSNLLTWPNVEAIRRSIPLSTGKNFLRLVLARD